MSKTFSPDKATLTQLVELVDRALQQTDTLHTFVIGAAFSSPNSTGPISERERFIGALRKNTTIRVHHPEGLFDELILSDKLNLIDLENVLADSVDAIIMCVESYGSVAELGAFATNAKLANKLFVIMDRKYRADKSFINLGPIRYMRVNRWGKVVWHAFGNEPTPHLLSQIRDFARSRREQSHLPRTWQNPIRLEALIHLLVMVYQPISEHNLLSIIDHIASVEFSHDYVGDSNLIQPIARAVIQKLSRDGSVRRELRVHPNFKTLRVGTKPEGAKYPTHLCLAKEWTEVLELYLDRRYVLDVEQQLMASRVRAMNSMFRIRR